MFAGIGDGYSDYPGRQLLLHKLADYGPVFFLRWRQKGEKWWLSPRVKKIRNNTFEVQNAFTHRNSRLRKLGRISGIIDGWLLRKILRQHGVTEFVYWLSVPEPHLLWGMPCDCLVYDCVDPCFIPEEQQKFDEKECDVARKAKIVTCTAQSLYKRIKSINSKCYLLPNACSMETYEAKVNDEIIELPLLKNKPRPYIGYMGTVDWRFDVDAIRYAARTLPQYTFVIVGRVNSDQEARVAELRRCTNVIFVGAVARREGDAYVNAFDVGTIPFIPGRTSYDINPVKLYMYLVAGKPVVSTSINECRLHSEFVSVANTPAEFAALINAAAQNDDLSSREARIEFGLKNRWEDRATTIVEILNAECML